MNTETCDIRRIRRDELSLIRDFPPREWNLDLEKLYCRHFDREYFYPVVAVINGDIAGTGIAIVNGSAAWLGTIIVRETHRNRGIGNLITDHLITYARGKGTDSILLIASNLGLPVYQKLGFQRDIDYVFFKTDSPTAIESANPNIGPITPADYDAIIALDRAITGEQRRDVLADCLKTGFTYRDDRLRGYYLPEFGTGLIIADSETAGTELLKYRFSRDTSSICVPETNTAATALLTSLGYYPYMKLPRMFLHNNVQWDSKKIYSRGAGYFG